MTIRRRATKVCRGKPAVVNVRFSFSRVDNDDEQVGSPSQRCKLDVLPRSPTTCRMPQTSPSNQAFHVWYIIFRTPQIMESETVTQSTPSAIPNPRPKPNWISIRSFVSLLWRPTESRSTTLRTSIHHHTRYFHPLSDMFPSSSSSTTTFWHWQSTFLHPSMSLFIPIKVSWRSGLAELPLAPGLCV